VSHTLTHAPKKPCSISSKATLTIERFYDGFRPRATLPDGMSRYKPTDRNFQTRNL
jgi:hypothetical protein